MTIQRQRVLKTIEILDKGDPTWLDRIEAFQIKTVAGSVRCPAAILYDWGKPDRRVNYNIDTVIKLADSDETFLSNKLAFMCPLDRDAEFVKEWKHQIRLRKSLIYKLFFFWR